MLATAVLFALAIWPILIVVDVLLDTYVFPNR